MRIVKLKGGLGNQMFQYTFAKLIEKTTGDEVKLDFSAYSCLQNDVVRKPRIHNFNISLDAASQKEIDDICIFQHKGNSQTDLYRLGIAAEGILNKNYYFERTREYKNPDTLKNFLYYDGYWVAWKYVEEMKDILRTEFVPNYELSQKTKKTIAIVQKQNSVFVGIRRGDYLNTKNKMNKIFGTLGPDYYLRAMKCISERIEKPVFYIFSNDIEWCKNNLELDGYNVNFRESEMQTSDFEEMMIMASCKHGIIANSTYYWWGAWLGNNKEKIIVTPEKWTIEDRKIEILPPNWIGI